MAVQVPNKPQYQSALVQVNRIIAPEWLRWFNQIQNSAAAVADLEAQLAALAALVATDQANIATLKAQMVAVLAAQAAAEAAIAALQTSVRNLQAVQNLHTLQLSTQQAEIDALQAAGFQIDPTQLWSTPRDYTPQIEELRRLFATLDAPRDYAPQIEELRRLFATLDTAHDYSRDIQELRLLFATLDVALNPASLAALFQPTLTFPLTIAQGGTNAITAPLARTSLGAAGLADANTFTNTNTFNAAILGTLGGWTAWVPGLAAGGSMTISGVSYTATPQYLIIGSLIFIQLFVTVVFGGTASNLFEISLPFFPNASIYNSIQVQYLDSTGAWVNSGLSYIPPSSAFLLIFAGNALGTYVLGSTQFMVSGFYRLP